MHGHKACWGIQTKVGRTSILSYMFTVIAGRMVKILLKRDHCVTVQDEVGRRVCTWTNMLLHIPISCQASECGAAMIDRCCLHIYETHVSATAYKCRGGCHMPLWLLSIRSKDQVLFTPLYDLYTSCGWRISYSGLILGLYNIVSNGLDFTASNQTKEMAISSKYGFGRMRSWLIWQYNRSILLWEL
jgi:hypothetical protein